MKEPDKPTKKIYTLSRVLLFWVICMAFMAISSGLTKQLPLIWGQILTVSSAALGSFVLTILFCRWEGLQLKDVGVIPGVSTLSRVAIGFIIGLFLASLQVLLIALNGHLSIALSSQMSFTPIGLNLLLYAFIALREEIAFRGFPLRSINYVAGPWVAQVFIVVIFIVEHILGGMTWWQAILGSGTGAVLFGLAALKSKGIALPIGLHFAWNFGQWFWGFKNDTGIYTAVIEKGSETRVEQTGMIYYLLVMGLAIFACYKCGQTTRQ
ncbi:CPBP family intramembrane glutamic endopeptidase [Pedobacter foliorum]|uniref:CPBP family intramembrane glutamic endopeptidase n=1 Tax=Pedobacter foliorum TaxID=2739058 RepID=UPI0015643540|nr:type II CAAX endopeptidase family protein [Pedobacter foliorum]NRF39459.1 CPBP family intramembrane metalloprotease [Pedobacter foliorum]